VSQAESHETAEPAPWEFRNTAGESLGRYKYSDFDSIRADLLTGKLPADALCRQNPELEFQPIKDSLAREEFRIGVLFDPVSAHVRRGAAIGGAVLGASGGIVILIAQIGDLLEYGFAVGRAFWMFVGFGVGVVVCALAGFALGAAIGGLVGLIRRTSFPQIPGHAGKGD
jgi:hypothetical protein